LALLIAACLAIIFYPIGPAPAPQDVTLRFTSPQPLETLAKAAAKADKQFKDKKDVTPSQIVEAALLKTFPAGREKLPPGDFVVEDGGKSATLVDTIDTRGVAVDRAQRIQTALQKSFPGIKIEPKSLENLNNLPVQPLMVFGKTAIYPLRRDTAVKLGLDLRGGVNLVLQVRRALFTYTFDTKAVATPEARENLIAQVRTALTVTDAGLKLGQADVNFTPGTTDRLEVRTQAETEADFNSQTIAINAALKAVPDAKLAPARKPQFFQPKTADGQPADASFEKARLARTLEIVRARVDKLGVAEPLIQSQGDSRIIVQLPGVNDPQKAVEVIGTTAQMEIRLLPQTLVPDNSDESNIRFRDAKTGAPVSSARAREMSELLVPGEDVKPTTYASFSGDIKPIPAVNFELGGEGSRRFADVTREVQGKGRYIPIFLDEKCISAPTVNSAIRGSGQISGGFQDLNEARELALLLNSGALPAPIDVVENRTVSATLGTDSLLKSLRAGLIGLAAVAIFMLLFYRLAGLLANFALMIYIVLNLAAFILVGGTLTLPGIAGFLLAIAMSLDTNILVFERLKEEMAIQPTFAAALRAAFSRAWTAILDSHVTTLIAAAVLFNFGTGPIKGFALTLGIGVLLSLFSAISVTRLFMWSAARSGENNRNLFGTPVKAANEVAKSTP